MKRVTMQLKRQEKKLTLRDLGTMVGYSFNYLSQIENGKRNPSIKLALKLEEILGVSAKELLSEKIKELETVMNGGRSA